MSGGRVPLLNERGRRVLDTKLLSQHKAPGQVCPTIVDTVGQPVHSRCGFEQVIFGEHQEGTKCARSAAMQEW
jgi:hypothetical protein